MKNLAALLLLALAACAGVEEKKDFFPEIAPVVNCYILKEMLEDESREIRHCYEVLSERVKL